MKSFFPPRATKASADLGQKLKGKKKQQYLFAKDDPDVFLQAQRLTKAYGTPLHIAVYDPKIKFFRQEGIDALVGFKKEAGRVVVMGPPLCAPQDLEKITEAFTGYCKKKGWPRIYMGSSPAFTALAKDRGMGGLLTGVEHFINPQEFVVDAPPAKKKKGQEVKSTMKLHKDIRTARNNARSDGIKMTEVARQADGTIDPQIEKEISELVAASVRSRQGLQVYACDMDPFASPDISRWFLARDSSARLIGVLTLHQMGDNEYVFDHSVKLPDDKIRNNLPTALYTHCLETLRSEGCSRVSFGVTEKKQLERDGIFGFSEKQKSPIAWGHEKLSPLLNSEKKGQNRERFGAQSQDSYVIYDPPKLGLRTMLASTRAVNVPDGTVMRQILSHPVSTLKQAIGRGSSPVKADAKSASKAKVPPLPRVSPASSTSDVMTDDTAEDRPPRPRAHPNKKTKKPLPLE